VSAEYFNANASLLIVWQLVKDCCTCCPAAPYPFNFALIYTAVGVVGSSWWEGGVKENENTACYDIVAKHFL
jgi:hypothetical protein